MNNNTFKVANDSVKQSVIRLIQRMPYEPAMIISITACENSRTLEQNAMMWGLLTQLQKRATWHNERYHKEDWKDLLTAGLEKQRIVPGIEGGFVALGQRTSKMSVKNMNDLIEFIFYFAAENPPGLKFEGFLKHD